jgi:hypothetical protein
VSRHAWRGRVDLKEKSSNTMRYMYWEPCVISMDGVVPGQQKMSTLQAIAKKGRKEKALVGGNIISQVDTEGLMRRGGCVNV